MSIQLVNASENAKAVFPYSHAAIVDKTIYLSGSIGQTPAGEMAEGFEGQLAQVFVNLKNVLKACHSDLQHVVKVNVFLVDMNDFPKLNEFYAKAFEGHKPARSTVQVARLPRDALVEIEAIAIVATPSNL